MSKKSVRIHAEIDGQKLEIANKEKKEGSKLEQIAEELLLLPEVARVFIENINIAVIGVDSNGVIRIVNKQAEFLFGYHRSELRGKKVEILIPDSLRGKHVKHRESFADNPKQRPMGQDLSLRGKRKDGKEIDLKIELQPEMLPKIGLLTLAIITKKNAK